MLSTTVRSYQLLSFSLIGLLATTVRADPKTPRKAAEADASLAQIAAWSAAVTADKAGDLEDAAGHYQEILTADARNRDTLKPLPNAMWNLSDVERRRERYPQAIKLLESYKQLVKTDAERAAADKIIAEIRATPYRVWISGRPDAVAVVYIDGVRVGTAPLGRELPTGWHQIDMISATAYDQQSVESKPMTSHSVEMRDHYGTAGNVVLSTSSEFRRSGSWDTNGVRYDLTRRRDFPPGHYETQPWNEKDALCKPIAFDVPKTGLLFVYIDAGPKPADRSCQPVKIVTQLVKLP